MSPNRDKLADAANSGKWFKRIDYMEQAARDIIAPDLAAGDSQLNSRIDAIVDWAIAPDD